MAYYATLGRINALEKLGMHTKEAFTLVELGIVTSILGILATVSIPAAIRAQMNNKLKSMGVEPPEDADGARQMHSELNDKMPEEMRTTTSLPAPVVSGLNAVAGGIAGAGAGAGLGALANRLGKNRGGRLGALLKAVPLMTAAGGGIAGGIAGGITGYNSGVDAQPTAAHKTQAQSIIQQMQQRNALKDQIDSGTMNSQLGIEHPTPGE